MDKNVYCSYAWALEFTQTHMPTMISTNTGSAEINALHSVQAFAGLPVNVYWAKMAVATVSNPTLNAQ